MTAIAGWARAHRAVVVVALAALLVAAMLAAGLGTRAAFGEDGGTAAASPTTSAEPTAAPTAGAAALSTDGDSAAGTNGAGDDNVAVANNTRDGGEVYSVRLKIVQTDGPVVDAGNAAVAAASCADCTTVAIALEGVLVYGDDITEVTPVNLAIALNTDCSGCQTLAAAYQTVTQNESRVRITGAGRQRVAHLRQQLNTLRTRDLPIEQIAAEADRIAAEFAEVLRTEVVPIGRPAAPTPSPGTVAEPGATSTSVPTPTGQGPTTEPTSADPPLATPTPAG